MAFGAMLTDQQGVPFYIDGTMPLTLINRIVINVPGDNSGTVYTQPLYANDGAVRFVFMQSNNSNTGSAEWMQLDNNVWTFYSTRSSKTVTIFIFGYAYQPVPSWGIAIYDGAGNCVLTNESKVLKGVTKIGDVTNASASGYNINTTLGGSWAVAPAFTGILTAVDNSTGQPRPVVIWYWASAYFNGSSTQISSHTHGSGAGVQNPSYSNARNALTVIDVNKY